MKLQFIVIVFIVTTAIIYGCSKPKNNSPQTTTDSDKLLPQPEVTNTKLILIEKATETEVKKILQDFCTTYNQETHQVVLRLQKLSTDTFVVTFPYDCKFDTFCFFINYANYPIGFDKKFKATGWAYTKSDDIWITELIANKSVMVFVSENEEARDNVFLTTTEGIGYKFGFAKGEGTQLLKAPEKKYKSLALDFKTLDSREYTDFK